MYNLKNQKDRNSILRDADKDGDECPVDAICDSVPGILLFVKELEGKIHELNSQVQKLEADKKDLERKLNNTKSQKFRILKKKRG
jgi:hypothetical protein